MAQTETVRDDSNSTETLTPEQRLEASPRLITAGIATINNLETLRECVAYENANQNRTLILDRLARRAQELRQKNEQ